MYGGSTDDRWEPLLGRLPSGQFEIGKDGTGLLIVGFDGTVGVPWQFVRIRGDTARELETLAASCMADAIVVGRSRSMWHTFGGSVAVGLAKRARRTVLIVP